MSHTPPVGHCRAQRQALEYYSTGASAMVVPETVLSEAQEYDWAACYDEVERWHTPEPESVHEQGTSSRKEDRMEEGPDRRVRWTNANNVVEKGKTRPVRVLKEDGKSESAKLWCLKVEKDGICTGCGGKRVAARS